MADAKISALTANTAPASLDEFVHVDKSDTSEAATGTDKKITWGDITANVVLSGVDSSKPAFNAVPAGTLYYSTDLFTLQRSDGVSAWLNVGLSPNVVDAKGNLIAATADNAVAKVAVGVDGQVMTADSSATPGVAWKGGLTLQTPFVPPFVGIPVSTATGATQSWYAIRITLTTTTTINGIRVVTGATANGNLRSALYASDTTTKLADKTTDAAQAAAGNITTLAFASSYDAAPGVYYALVWYSSATATFAGVKYPTSQSTATGSGTTTPANVGTPAYSASLFVPQMALY